MFKTLFSKKDSIDKLALPEVDVALRLMFEVAMSVNCRTLYFEEFNYLKRRIEDVGVFSRKTRKLESNIQEEKNFKTRIKELKKLTRL